MLQVHGRGPADLAVGLSEGRGHVGDRDRRTRRRSGRARQHHESEQWLQRQLARQVQAEYFPLTCALPAELRSVAWAHQHSVSPMGASRSRIPGCCAMKPAQARDDELSDANLTNYALRIDADQVRECLVM
ncbi:MAG: hypothetical protein ACREPU_10765 [Rhodanobacteraceae bacterium]